MSHRGELLELLTRCVRDGAVRLMLQRAEAECMLVAPGLAARLRDVDAAAAKGALAQLDTVIETGQLRRLASLLGRKRSSAPGAAAEKTLSTLLEDRAKQAAAAAASWQWLTGCSSAVFEEVRGVLRVVIEEVLCALAPSCWPAKFSSMWLTQGVGPELSVGFRPKGHTLTAEGVLTALCYAGCISAQSPDARPTAAAGARRAALQQCSSLAQLVRCILVQPQVVGQLVRGIAVEQLAATPADVAELCRAFEDEPALVRLLPRRAQAAPGRLLQAQQRLRLAQLGVQECLDSLDSLGTDTVEETLGWLHARADLPRNQLRCAWPLPPPPASPAQAERGESEGLASEPAGGGGEPEPEAVHGVPAGNTGGGGGGVSADIVVRWGGPGGPVIVTVPGETSGVTSVSYLLAAVTPELQRRQSGTLVCGSWEDSMTGAADERYSDEPNAPLRLPGDDRFSLLLSGGDSRLLPYKVLKDRDSLPTSELAAATLFLVPGTTREREWAPLAEIRAVLAQVHPDTRISPDGRLMAEDLLFGKQRLFVPTPCMCAFVPSPCITLHRPAPFGRPACPIWSCLVAGLTVAIFSDTNRSLSAKADLIGMGPPSFCPAFCEFGRGGGGSQC